MYIRTIFDKPKEDTSDFSVEIMEVLVLLALTSWLKICFCEEVGDLPNNSSDLNKDMYVIHAMVYQVGIVTNKTDDETLNGTIGSQETLTLYKTNGSSIDLSGIPAPLMTNVSAQSLVGVAPKNDYTQGWPLSHFTSGRMNLSTLNSGNNDETTTLGEHSFTEAEPHQKIKRSWKDTFDNIFKRDVSGDNITVKITKGTAEIPVEAGVNSIAIPPLLTLNNNFSEIPVPIPNTSVVHYAKINTLVRAL